MAREFAAALLATALGGIAVIASFAATWTVARVPVFEGQVTPTTEVVLSGADLVPAGTAAGWVILAGSGGLIATRRLGRRIVGGVIAVAAAAAGAAALIGARTLEGRAASAAGGSGTVEVSGLAPWWALATLGAAAALAAGFLALTRGPTWPSLGARYERRRPAPSAGPVSAAEAWDALDRGEDPTLASPPDEPRPGE